MVIKMTEETDILKKLVVEEKDVTRELEKLVEDARNQFGLSKYAVMWIAFLKGIVLTLLVLALI